jgi:hypothetical protein
MTASAAVLAGPVLGGKLTRDDRCAWRVEVELAVDVERELAVGVDVRPEQRRERAAVHRGQAAGPGGSARIRSTSIALM